jgi:UDP-glucose:(heptosyl)LPS alpha-1,3-glucosyltransferase
LKIALVILHADPARGGAERYTIDLAAALARAGHDVSLAATSFVEVPPGVRRVDLRGDGMTRLRRYRRMLDSLDAHLGDAKYDIVHAMLPVRRCDVYHPHAGIALAAMDRWTVHFNRRRKEMAQAERELLSGPRPPVVLCLSEYVKQSVRERYPMLTDARLATLFNAVDLDRFAPQPQDRRESVNGLFIGHDFVRKGLVTAIAAMRTLHDRRLYLTVVGKKPWSCHLPPAPDVAQKGAVADTRPYYRDADFFVLPTTHDPCSLVVLEALAMGVPVISTRFNGASEIMTDGVHGFVLDDPTDVKALAAAMRKMLDPEVRARMSAACLELRPRLSYENHLRTLLRIYDQVVQARRS